MNKDHVLTAENEAVLKEIRYDEKGLVPAIVQDEARSEEHTSELQSR